MKPDLKISFSKFYQGFDPGRMPQDYFCKFLMSHKYNVVVGDKNPDLVFYSVFGDPPKRSEYKSDPLLVACSYEPYDVGGDFDFAFGYGTNAYRFPLWLAYIIWDETNLDCEYELKNDPLVGQGCHHTPGYRLKMDNGLDKNPLFISNILKRHESNSKKTRFCNFTYTNPVPTRMNCFHFLNQYKNVESTGRLLNNTGYEMISKSKELSDYKFTIAFENSILPGYNTEKLLEPLVAGSVPIYLGFDTCFKDFNSDAFIYANQFKTFEDLVSFVAKVDNDDGLYDRYLGSPVFGENQADVLDRPRKLFEEINKRLISKKPKFQEY